MKIVNKRPRNLLHEIQNVFINGKQVKTAKITQIIHCSIQSKPVRQTMREQWLLNGDNAYQGRFQAAANSLAAWKWVVDISAFQYTLKCGVYYTSVSKYNTLHTTLHEIYS